MPKRTPDPDALPEPEPQADAEPTHADYLAPDGTPWATYLGTALGDFLADPLHQPAPWEQWRAWDTAGRPER